MDIILTKSISLLFLWQCMLHLVDALELTKSIPQKYLSDQDSNDGNQIESRIIGGQLIGEYALPFQLHFSYRGDVECGATLVEVYAIQIAITATHCLWTGYPHRESVKDHRHLSVTAGDRKLSDKDTKREQMRKVTKVAPHPSYDPQFFTNDIAILFIESNFIETDYVTPITLPGHDWAIPKTVRVSGWGSQNYGEDLQDDLRWVEIPTMDQFTCDRFNLIPWIDITNKQFCVGELGAGRRYGSCSGDSGGPAVGKNDTTGQLYLAGVVSFAITLLCGDPNYPTIYASVPKYMDWIRIEVSKYKEENQH